MLCSGSITVDLVVEEEEETAAGWRSLEMTETGPNQRHVTNALNSESVLLPVMRGVLQTKKVHHMCREVRKYQGGNYQLYCRCDT